MNNECFFDVWEVTDLVIHTKQNYPEEINFQP